MRSLNRGSMVIVFVVAVAAAVATPEAPAQDCVGACREEGVVEITDLIIGVNIALGQTPIERCLAFDPNDNGVVSVAELIAGVLNARDGCFTPHYNTNNCRTAPPITARAIFGAAYLPTATANRGPTDPQLSCGCAESPRTVWATFTAPATGAATVTIFGDHDATVAVFSGGCDALSELACGTSTSGHASTLHFTATEAATYLIEASAPCNGEGGELTIGVDLCGDNVVSGEEQCDDGNTMEGDGCNGCVFEDLAGFDANPGPCLYSSGVFNVFGLRPVGQLFSPSASQLGGVDFLLEDINPPHMDTVVLNLRDGGLGGRILASAATPLTPARIAWHHFRFAAPVAVVPGATYALELIASNDSVGAHVYGEVSRACAPNYPEGGKIVAGSESDEEFIFRTYAR